jgi:UDP-N-acetylmuramyl pentapeptide phosphotransferase/UDP-N-acetylglucosamine-1-phosphate transferase
VNELLVFVGAACAGAAIAWRGSRSSLANPPEVLIRTNVSGAPVPAVLGLWVVVGGVVPILVLSFVAEQADLRPQLSPDRWAGAALILLVAMGVAGRWDDRRGDEQPRGFAGHLSAMGGRRLTGGIVKIVAAAGAGFASSITVFRPWGVADAILTIAAVGLTANLVNLLDRAPGRAGKVSLLGGLLLVAFGSTDWALAAAGALGALVVVLPADLGERGMLGDAGANPLGALLGLGLVASLPRAGLVAAVAVLGALNLASERWSFSAVIERTPALRMLDGLGRK